MHISMFQNANPKEDTFPQSHNLIASPLKLCGQVARMVDKTWVSFGMRNQSEPLFCLMVLHLFFHSDPKIEDILWLDHIPQYMNK